MKDDTSAAALAKTDRDTRSYLEQGRRFEDLELATLTSRWLEARRGWLRSKGSYNPGELAHLTAEFTLRQLDPPYELAPESRPTAKRRNNSIGIAIAPLSEGFKEGAGAFGRDLKAQWKPHLRLFPAFGLGVVLARYIIPPQDKGED